MFTNIFLFYTKTYIIVVIPSAVPCPDGGQWNSDILIFFQNIVKTH